MRRPVLLSILGLLALTGGASLSQYFELEKLPPPFQYGDVVIDRSAATSGLPAVGFSHWQHRTRFTCRVCHFELYFAMQVNATEITEEKNLAGEFCGACHDGEIAFAHTRENCHRCHRGSAESTKQSFKKFRKRLPSVPFGNEIDWSAALTKGLIRPRSSLLDDDYQPMPFDKELELRAEWHMIPPAVFPHDQHQLWHDCAECHPDIFNVKKKTTEHFRMKFILEGKFCGVCHLRVAFPLNHCKRCHPAMDR